MLQRDYFLVIAVDAEEGLFARCGSMLVAQVGMSVVWV